MKTLVDYLPFRHWSRREFVDKHPQLFLLLDSDSIPAHEDREFNTATVGTDAKRRVEVLKKLKSEGLELDPDVDRYWIAEICKRDGHLYADHIFVGRTDACDIVIADGSISKMHAYFEFIPSDRGYVLVDNRSTNGTRVNGRRVRNQREGVKSGDTVEFGNWCFAVVDARGIWDLLARCCRARADSARASHRPPPRPR